MPTGRPRLDSIMADTLSRARYFLYFLADWMVAPRLNPPRSLIVSGFWRKGKSWVQELFVPCWMAEWACLFDQLSPADLLLDGGGGCLELFTWMELEIQEADPQPAGNRAAGGLPGKRSPARHDGAEHYMEPYLIWEPVVGIFLPETES